MTRALVATAAALTGCISPVWGILPGDGFTAVPADAPITLRALGPVGDARPLRPIVDVRRDGGAPWPFDIAWSADDPATVRLVPLTPWPDDDGITVTVDASSPASGHDADPAVRILPRRLSARFDTRSAPTLLAAAACADADARHTGGLTDGVALVSEPLDAPPRALVGDRAVAVDWWTVTDRLWAWRSDTPVDAILLPGGTEAPAGGVVDGDQRLDVVCDSAGALDLARRARGDVTW